MCGRACSSVGRALSSHDRGPRFKSVHAHHSTNSLTSFIHPDTKDGLKNAKLRPQNYNKELKMPSLNHLHALEQLQNTYYELRHGRSVPQENGIILSDPIEAGRRENGLVEVGRQSVKLSVDVAMRDGLVDARTIIKSSPLSRALETAEISQKVLSAGIIVVEPGLRERCFGRYEGKSNKYYQAVWDLDVIDPDHTDMGVESANAVQQRFSKVILETEKEFHGRIVLLVGHGDTLQIGETAFQKLPASIHRSLPPLQNAEIRRMQLGNR